MSQREEVGAVANALQGIRRDLELLEAAGQGTPAVEKNVIRMRGTLRALEVQFTDLHAVWSGTELS